MSTPFLGQAGERRRALAAEYSEYSLWLIVRATIVLLNTSWIPAFTPNGVRRCGVAELPVAPKGGPRRFLPTALQKSSSRVDLQEIVVLL